MNDGASSHVYLKIDKSKTVKSWKNVKKHKQ